MKNRTLAIRRLDRFIAVIFCINIVYTIYHMVTTHSTSEPILLLFGFILSYAVPASFEKIIQIGEYKNYTNIGCNHLTEEKLIQWNHKLEKLCIVCKIIVIIGYLYLLLNTL